jgi:DNA-binding NarL/FixJ family response regulator
MTDVTEHRGTVVIAEDDVLLREGVATILSRAGYKVVALVGDAMSLLEAVGEHRPSLVITDIRMPPSNTTDGLDAARNIRSSYPETAVLVLSAHAEPEQAIELLAGGRGVGYLLKSRVMKAEEFIDAVEHVVGGGTAIDPDLVRDLLGARRRTDPLGSLTVREREVLALMAEGRSNAGIARQLWVTEGTVEKHVQSILGKLDLGDAPDDHRRVRAVLRFLDAT